jgi:outer membrane protein insertion porin family
MTKLSWTRTPLVPIAAVAVLASLLGIVDVRPVWAQAGVVRAVVAQQYRIGAIKVTGVKSLPTEMVQGGLGLVSGEFFDESQLLKGLNALTKGYGRLGFINSKATPVLDFDEERKIVNLTVNIDEGREFYVNRITITGNTRTRDELIRREIPLREGFLFDSLRLEMGLLSLNKGGLLEEIKIDDVLIKPSSSEPKVDIEIRVREKAQ